MYFIDKGDDIMFRPMRRFRQEMTREACEEILRTAPSGVLSLLDEDGYPYGVPMDHWYCPEDGNLYFTAAGQATKSMPSAAVIRHPTALWTRASGRRGTGH